LRDENERLAAKCDEQGVLERLDADALLRIVLRANPLRIVLRWTVRKGERSVTEVGPEGVSDAVKRAVIADAGPMTEPTPPKAVPEEDLLPVTIRVTQGEATVTVDRNVKATAPAEFKLAPGSHLFSVSRPGYVTQNAFLKVEGTGLEHSFDLQADPAPLATAAGSQQPAEQPTDPGESRASAWNYVIAGAAIVAGGLLVIQPIQTLASEGECTRWEGSQCTDHVTFDVLRGVMLVGGGILVGTGVVVGVVAPLRVEVSEHSASLSVRGRF
jgi:hypothetical protein